MASPHTAADMLQPLGKLTSGLFPQFDDPDDLDTFLESLLQQGYDAATGASVADEDLDAAAIAYAYHSAYEAIWQRLSATPASADISGEASRTYLGSQIATFEKLKDRYWDEYAIFLPTPPPPLRGAPMSQAVPVRFGW